MPPIDERFRPEDRAREKELSREQDEFAVRSGLKSREELSRENGHFANLGGRPNLGRARALY